MFQILLKILIKILLKFILNGLIDNNSTFVQVMFSTKPWLTEPVMTQFFDAIGFTRAQFSIYGWARS